MRIRGWIIFGVIGAVLGAPDPALAWGPATHIGLGSSVLDSLSLLPGGIAALLARYGLPFLYGNVAADVVFAKRLSRVKQFCHHWSTAFGLLETAQDDAGKAFAYGYLSHLAADTVAHGKYVPRQVLVSECSVHFGHLHWELRADGFATDVHRRLLQRVLAGDHTQQHRALERHITDTFLPYDLNRLLFHRMNALAVRPEFRQTVTAWNRCSRWDLSPQLIHDYRLECLDRIHAILTEGPRSSLVRDDPNGTSALMQLRVRRREVRRLKRRGIPVAQRLREASHGFAPDPDGTWVTSAHDSTSEALCRHS